MEAERTLRPVAATAGHTVQVPSVLQCGLLILAVKVALKTWGFGRTLSCLRARVERVPRLATGPANVDAMTATERAVAIAGALYPGRALCLEQSLVLYWLLRRQGVAVKYCQGFQAHPFQAHAWIEYQRDPINDVAEHVRLYARLPDQLP
jgi:hypothetical protein